MAGIDLTGHIENIVVFTTSPFIIQESNPICAASSSADHNPFGSIYTPTDWGDCCEQSTTPLPLEL